LASWYGDAFHGRLTANGEVYDVRGLTAAHPTMPLPSYARVTNLRNNRSVVVRVNDRGPFARGRIIDVSETAAEMLGFRRAGTAKVKVEYVGPARMDGLDHDMLVASYKAPGIPGQPVMVADRRTENLVVAAGPAPRPRPDLFDDFEPPPTIAYGDPLEITPASAAYDDPLAPLILRESFAASYAPVENRLSAAHRAAANLAGSDSSPTTGSPATALSARFASWSMTRRPQTTSSPSRRWRAFPTPLS
jgi:rare lipoprotein A